MNTFIILMAITGTNNVAHAETQADSYVEAAHVAEYLVHEEPDFSSIISITIEPK